MVSDILWWLLARAHTSGRALSLHVLKTNPRAVEFYKRAGLHVVTEEPLKVLMRSEP